MKIPFQQEREISTSELPGVVCHPALIFHFDASPNIQFMKDLSAWSKNDGVDRLETIRLGAMLIKAVTFSDEKHALGTPDSIADLAQQTSEDFIPGLLLGWFAFIQTERLADLGKLKPLSALLSGSGDENDQA
jgi:hypothetical protein